MILQSIQFRNLGALGNSGGPLLLHQLPMEKPLDTIPVNNLGVTILHGANYIGKTTLKLSIYFVLGGSREVDGRIIPSALVRDGCTKLSVALTVRHFGEAQGLLWGPNNTKPYTSDQVTLVRQYEKGGSSTYHLIDGFHNLAEPFPTNTTKKREEYLTVLSRMGVNEGVLRVYRQAMRQGQISALTELRDTEVFNRIAEVAGYERRQTDYGQKRNDLIKQFHDIQVRESDAQSMEVALELAKKRRDDYQRLLEISAKLASAQETYFTHKGLYHSAAIRLLEKERAKAEEGMLSFQTEFATHEAQTAAKREELTSLSQRIAQLEKERREKEQLLRNDAYSREARIKQFQIFHQATIDNTPAEALEKTFEEWSARIITLQPKFEQALGERNLAQKELAEIEQDLKALKSEQSKRRLPLHVEAFSQALRAIGVEHNFLADVLNILDESWQRPIEEYLGQRRFWAMISPADFSKAQRIVEDLGYRPGICVPRPLAQNVRQTEHGTVWEVLELADQRWSGHIDDLGSQIRADSADQIQAARQSGRRVFTKRGLVSDAGQRAYSIRVTDKQFVLCCGTKALEMQFTYLQKRLPLAAMELERHQEDFRLTQTRLEAAKKLAEQRAKYDQAQKELPSVEQLLAELEGEIVERRADFERLEKERDALIDQRYTLQNEIEQAQQQFKEIEMKVREAGDIARKSMNSRKMHEKALAELTILDKVQLEILFHQQIAANGGDNLATMKKMVEDEEEIYEKAEAESANYESERRGILGNDDLTERDEIEYQLLSRDFEQKKESLEAARTSYQSQVAAIQVSYEYLKKGMELATKTVEDQANEIGKPLGIEFRLKLNMLDPGDFIDIADTREFVPTVELRVKFDDEQQLRPMQDPRLSGGQKEMASICLMGGFLFAAQQMEDRSDSRPLSWQNSPPLLLDEPFKSLSFINARRAMGGLLEIPSQIIIADPRPAKEVRDASEIIISLKREASMHNGNEAKIVSIDVLRGTSVLKRDVLARVYRSGLEATTQKKLSESEVDVG